ncbi:MAG: hypothetical protein P8013_06150 [Candidatus Sulfobium sp.]|jgi:hypothetical protein
MKTSYRGFILWSSCFFFVVFIAGTASGWNDRTHLAIAKAAGYPEWYNAAGADITKVKAGNTEKTNHWSDNTGVGKVTAAMVMGQVKRYNEASDEEGHLYGAIIASVRNYIKDKQAGKYAGYHMAFCAHYIGDLSMPLHNVPYNDFNKKHHVENDGIVELSALNSIGLIQRNVYPVVIHNERDLAREIARIANVARDLAAKMEQGDRDMTRKEAYTELSHSASLLKGVLSYARDMR